MPVADMLLHRKRLSGSWNRRLEGGRFPSRLTDQCTHRTSLILRHVQQSTETSLVESFGLAEGLPVRRARAAELSAHFVPRMLDY